MDQSLLKTLLQRYQDGTATKHQMQLLAVWYRDLSETEADFFENEQEEQQEMQMLWEQIREKALPGNDASVAYIIRIKALLKWTAAAVIIGLMGGVWWWSSWESKPIVIMPGQVARIMQETGKKQESWMIRENTTKKELTIVLGEGSVVKLAPGARITYRQPFPDTKRDIHLTGSAFFDVATSKTKPFTVYSGGLSTTALGTSFSVSETREGCYVKLFTGKVVINSAVTMVKGSHEAMYLLPGDELRLDNIQQTIVVNSFRQKAPEPAGKVVYNDRQSPEMIFNHTPLSDIFKQLAVHYHQTIDYDTTAVMGIHFSGTVLKDDSLSVILHVIGQMNHLTIIPIKNGFVISKNS